ncbi:MAG TPA: TetR/AcrR family transcriptional regulator C-terminal domain-containing protein [Propionibacteriaceae bacterium]|nr:TetR/AcrR family transcriptional regulator C-terminal domain-containing protein [Propionibacteriaceae bacterium]
MRARTPLSRERIIEAAAAVADEGGLSAVSMRNVGRKLGVEAMSLYHHVADKEALIDSLTDWVFAQVDLPVMTDPWRSAMASRAASARRVLSAHPWALGMIESRTNPGPATLRQHEAVLGNLRRAGFSVRLAGHTFSILDAYVFGFVLTEVHLPFEDDSGAKEFVGNLDLDATAFPYLSEFISDRVMGGSYNYGDEFDDGLQMILDAIEARLAAEASQRGVTGA